VVGKIFDSIQSYYCCCLSLVPIAIKGCYKTLIEQKESCFVKLRKKMLSTDGCSFMEKTIMAAS